MQLNLKNEYLCQQGDNPNVKQGVILFPCNIYNYKEYINYQLILSTMRKQSVCLWGIILTLILGCTDNETYKDASQPIEKRVVSLMKQMTLDEKIAQMDMFGAWDLEKYKTSGLMEKEGVGAWIGEMTPEQYNEIQSLSEKTRLKIPFLVGVDAAHGHALMPGRTVFPTSITIAAAFNPELVYRIAQITAQETRACGNQWTFAPSVDVVHDARWGRTGETYGECPFLSSVLVRKAVQGLQENDDPQKRVAASVKHLLGGGASVGGVNHGNAEISDRMLRTDFLPPFKAAVEAGTLTIMPGHNDINGIPMHSSRQILTDIIKKEYGFDGFYITDMGDIENLLPHRIHRTAVDQKDAVRQAISAGIDMHMYSWDKQMFIDHLRELVAEGKVSEERINDAARRILAVKFKLGLFEERYVKTGKDNPGYGSKEAKELALESARQTVVLLKNEQKQLPLPTNKYKKILVTGPNANNQAIMGDWAFTQPDDHIVTILEGIQGIVEKDVQVIHSNSGRLKGKKSKVTVETTDPETQARIQEEGGELNEATIEDAVCKAKQCDLAIVVIGGYGIRSDWGLRTYGESADRPSIDFYGQQSELVKRIHETGIPTIVVIVNGKPLNNPWITTNIPTIIDLWEPGMFGGQVLAEVLFGQVNPSGKLPITIPQTAGHIPQYYYQTKSRYTTGYGLGSSRKEDKPAFCFGHGLSYTTFEYKNLIFSDTLLREGKPLRVTLDIKNTGEKAGYETVLLFMKDEVSSVVTPLQRLKGFQKLWLEAGETKQVSITVPLEEFGLWNEQMKYVVESGEFEIQTGRSAEDIRLKGKVKY